MENGGSSHSNSISSIKSYSKSLTLCYCGKRTNILKSWTFDNPGRRFLCCDIHGFYKWVDEEAPHGWQKEALLEARNDIFRLKEKLKGKEAESSTPVIVNTKKLEEKIMKLEEQIEVGKEREKLFSQFIVLSWGGFVAATAIIIFMLK